MKKCSIFCFTVFGSILPSLFTIISNIISVRRVRELNRLTSMYILPCRRRTDDTRRVLLVITVECLFAIVNSWFSDIVLSLLYCGRNLSAGDDCPMYLRQNYDLLVMFDLFNSVSNIILHCLCGKRFRKELQQMFKSIFKFLKNLFRHIWCCYFRIDCHKLPDDPQVSYNASITRHESSNSSNSASNNHLYLQIHTPSRRTSKYCCACRWYFNRKPLVKSRQCCSTISKECLQKNRTFNAVRYTSISQRTDFTRQTQTNSIRLYYPQRLTTISTAKKTHWLNRH
jgi:hypothetical protein